MADEPTPKKVVKRVVKKPVAPSTTPSKPTMRYGRPVSGAPTKVAARDKPAPAPPTSPSRPTLKRPTVKAPGTKTPGAKTPGVDVKPMVNAIWSRTTSAASTIGARAGQAGRATGRFTADRWTGVRAWRIPQLEPIRATLITGFIAGLLSVALGVVALRMFSEIRGVASGGGTWGSLTFVVVTFVAFAAGDRLLNTFGTPLPRLTSFLGVLLTIITILGVFLGLADSRYGILIVPALTAAAFFAANRLLALAESSPVSGDADLP